MRNAKLCKICSNKVAQASEFAAKMCTLYTLTPSWQGLKMHVVWYCISVQHNIALHSNKIELKYWPPSLVYSISLKTFIHMTWLTLESELFWNPPFFSVLLLLFFLLFFHLHSKLYSFHLLFFFIFHTAWIWIWMTKRRGANSDNGFIGIGPKVDETHFTIYIFWVDCSAEKLLCKSCR